MRRRRASRCCRRPSWSRRRYAAAGGGGLWWRSRSPRSGAGPSWSGGCTADPSCTPEYPIEAAVTYRMLLVSNRSSDPSSNLSSIMRARSRRYWRSRSKSTRISQSAPMIPGAGKVETGNSSHCPLHSSQTLREAATCLPPWISAEARPRSPRATDGSAGTRQWPPPAPPSGSTPFRPVPGRGHRDR